MSLEIPEGHIIAIIGAPLDDAPRLVWYPVGSNIDDAVRSFQQDMPGIERFTVMTFPASAVSACRNLGFYELTEPIRLYRKMY
jgi:hypothetical protein